MLIMLLCPTLQCVVLCWFCFCFCYFWLSVVSVAYVVLVLFVCFFIHIFLGGCWASWKWKLRIISTNLGEIWHYIFKYLLLLFIFSFWESNCWSTWYWPYVSVALLCFFQYFSFLLLWLENFQKSFFKFTNSFFCYVKAVVEPVCWYFFVSVVTLFKYRILRIPFYIFYFCVKNSFLFMNTILSFNSSNLFYFKSSETFVLVAFISLPAKSGTWIHLESVSID